MKKLITLSAQKAFQSLILNPLRSFIQWFIATFSALKATRLHVTAVAFVAVFVSGFSIPSSETLRASLDFWNALLENILPTEIELVLEAVLLAIRSALEIEVALAENWRNMTVAMMMYVSTSIDASWSRPGGPRYVNVAVSILMGFFVGFSVAIDSPMSSAVLMIGALLLYDSVQLILDVVVYRDKQFTISQAARWYFERQLKWTLIAFAIVALFEIFFPDMWGGEEATFATWVLIVLVCLSLRNLAVGLKLGYQAVKEGNSFWTEFAASATAKAGWERLAFIAFALAILIIDQALLVYIDILKEL